MATYNPTVPPKSLQDVLAASPSATSVTGETELLTSATEKVKVDDLPFAPSLTPAERAAAGDVTLVVGYTLAGGGYDNSTLNKIATRQAAGWPDSAILVRVMGVYSGGPPDISTGSISTAAVSLRPTVAAPSLVGTQVGSITAAALSLRPTVSSPALTGVQVGSIAAASVSLTPSVSAGTIIGTLVGSISAATVTMQPSVSVGTLTGVQEGVGVIGAASVSLRPTVSVPTLTGVSIGSLDTAGVTLQPTVAAGILWTGDEAPVSVTLTPAPGAVILLTLDGSPPLDYIITDNGVALFDGGELLTTGDVR